MKQMLRNLFSPILKNFESGSGQYAYRKSHRIVLIVMGVLFSALAALVFSFSAGQEAGYLIPVIVFGALGIVSLIVGALGNDRAVSKIWGSK